MAHANEQIDYATVTADAYAVMHWKAQMDENDVEFVLGSAPRLKRAIHGEVIHQDYGPC
jgi:hypothetical protein